MLENFLKFTAKVEEEVSHWYLANGTKIETAEKMCLQFLQMLGQLKAQQEAQNAPQQDVSVEDHTVNQEPTPAE